MENCDVCCEKLNKINHKKVKCPFCDLTSCRSCSQRYILSTIDDPHCMGCKNMWNREFIDSFCTKYFRNNKLRCHREDLLFEREKLRIPETQAEVERILAIRKVQSLINEQRSKLVELSHQYQLYIPIHEGVIIPDEVQEIQEVLRQCYRKIEHLRQGGDIVVGEPKKFIRKCPTEECKGFMNEDWFCGLCDRQFCEKCNEEATITHICDPESVKTMELLKKDTKPCPKCGTVIQKLSGCRQMWCPDCHTAFDWVSGQIEIGRIHNPHYIEFKRSHVNGVSREHGDIPCGGIPSFRELRQINAPMDILQFVVLLTDLDRDLIYRYGNEWDGDNHYLRVAYMLNELTEPQFKKELQRRDKQREKFRDIGNIFRMIIDTGGDLLRQYVLNQEKYIEIMNILHNLIDYANEVIDVIRKRYNCVVPKNLNIYTL